jgi:glycosyltransferase involved in cell wall biosynthesis
MEKMKLCFIGNKSSPHVRKWLDEFSNRGYEVFCVTPSIRKGFVSKMFEAKRRIKEINPHIIHAHYTVGHGVFGAFSNVHPFIISCWGSDVRIDPKSMIKRLLSKFAFKKADIVHVQDPLMADRVKEIYPHKNIFIQAWGVNLDVFSPKNKESRWLNEIPTIICTRSVKPLYDIQTLLKAIPLILKKIDVKFVFTNPGFEKLLHISEKNYFIAGYLELDVYKKLIASCDLFVDTFYPFDGRGGQSYGQALLEAMASEIPTIVADRPTLHIKPEWYFGEIFKGGNHVDLAKKLIKLIEDKERQKEIVRKNKESIVKYFDWKKNMDKIEEKLYKVWERK